jgi:ATPase family associated with various cellular activities (AAA)
MSRINPSDNLPRSISDGQFLEQALTILALRLKHEVALTRALRGETRQEGFLGLFLTEEDAQAMLDELAGRVSVEGGADALARVARAEMELRHERAALPDLIWSRIGRAFELTDIELDLLLYAAAPSFDQRYGRVYGFLNDDMGRRSLTPALAHRLLEWHDLDLGTLRLCLSSDRPLQRHRLIRLTETTPRTEAAVTVPEEVIDLLLGLPPADPPVAERFDAIGEGEGETDIVVLVGRDCGGSALLSAGERPLLRLQAARVAHLDLAALRDTSVAFLRHSHFTGALPYLAGFDSAPAATRAEIARLVTAPCLVDAARMGVWADAGLAADERLAQPLSPATQAALLGSEGGLAGAAGVPFLDRLRLATQHAAAPTELAAGLRARAARGMESVAQPVESSFDFDDLVLPPTALRLLGDFVSWRIHAPHVLDRWGFGHTFNRRGGSVALFRGPPGTGKTVAASVVANAIGLPLYRVDLAGMVSKYIGETEKNLERLFTAAAASDVVLFFDEADALFGKRSEVSDAHDRYANIETSYLLQRIESQDGAVILATNLQDNLDTAFLRRIDIVVDFPAPGPADRLRLWRRLGATEAPVAADLDLPFLAEAFELTGGEIRNVLIAAAHAAARDGCAIGMGEIVRALAQELQKLGRPLRRQPFGSHFRHLREPPP